MSVDITGGLPRVSWSPDCAVGFIAVVDSATDDASWVIRASGISIVSPIETYATPRGAFVMKQLRGLVAGRTYEVVIAQRDTNPDTGLIGERQVG